MNTVAHTLTVTTIPNGHDFDWTHPDTCPDGDSCDIIRRTHRMGDYGMIGLGEGRPDGVYLLGLWHFNSLVLVDENGRILPNVDDN